MVSAEGHSIKTSYDQLTAVSENALSLKLGELSGRVETKRTKSAFCFLYDSFCLFKLGVISGWNW